MKIKVILLSCLMAVLMSACNSVEDWDDALLTIDCQFKPYTLTAEPDTLRYEISLIGPESYTINATLGDIIDIPVAVGDYKMNVNAFVGTTKKGIGGIAFKVTAGPNKTFMAGVGFTKIYTSVGEPGPCGGRIFYINEDGFRVYTSATDTVGIICHYLEAATADLGPFRWANTYPSIKGTLADIGAGRKNTAIILAAHTSNADAFAANACKNYGTTGDWYLPSTKELNLLYDHRGAIGGFTTTSSGSWYWSSVHVGNILNYKMACYFYNGSMENIEVMNSGISCRVRPIRAF